MVIPLKTNDFAHFFDSFERSAFRLETLAAYSVPDEADDFQRFLSGEPLPASANEEWCSWIREHTQVGKIIKRVHVISLPLSPYLRFEIDWRYVYNSAAGEDVYVIERSRVPTNEQLLTDYWLFDDRVVVRFQYDSNGQFLGGEVDDAPEAVALYREASASLLSLATPLKQFLATTRNAQLRQD